ncbi:helix-turn-helix transcriptional regulator [Clostridium botulinum]|uniref:helix-turn-helix transcriptional regulator n=1 Tax=Clostridium botulinum TaxID=1491 RepID=UPI0004D3ABE6|nr:helix-turn-helix transcriptional regulator [Clostridium botulinum]KEH96135.1 DNA binding protein [Clostridium botulinum D str. 16868]
MAVKTLRELRISKGILSSFVAKKLEISCRHFTRIETGEGYLTKERAKKLSEIYNVSISEIKKLGGIKC